MKQKKRPKIIAFYAYKGGTGRSFALAHTAWALAREGRRLVIIDLDLSAPSLWAMFGREPAPGFVEYLGAWAGQSPLDIRELVQEVPLDPKASGEIYLLPAGRMDKSYLEALQTLDWHEVLRRQPPRTRKPQSLFDLTTPFGELFDSIVEHLQPDAVLLDAPTGFNDTANLCLRVLADLVIAVFAPTRVHLGLHIHAAGSELIDLSGETQARLDVYGVDRKQIKNGGYGGGPGVDVNRNFAQVFVGF